MTRSFLCRSRHFRKQNERGTTWREIVGNYISADSRVETTGGRDVLLIKRFGRDKTDYGYTRSRMISALTVLLADEAPGTRSRWSYVLLVVEWRRSVAEPENSAHELFRRMCFNALISNLDDHPRNHAFIAKDQD